MNLKHLILCGGGAKGLCFIGALNYIFKKIDINNIQSYSGSSAGSIIAFFLNIGCTPNELKNIFFNLDLSNYTNIKFETIINDLGFDDCEKIINLLKSIMISKGIDFKINFYNLFNITKKHLYITGTNLSNEKPEYFCYENTPKMMIIDAIRISISVPILFTPINYNNNIYVDGAILSPYPNDYVKKKDGSKLGIMMSNKNKKKIKENYNEFNFYNYILKIINSSYNFYLNKKIKKYNDEIIKIKLNSHINGYNLNKLTKKDFKMMYLSGVDSSIKYLKKNYNNYFIKKKYYNIWKIIK